MTVLVGTGDGGAVTVLVGAGVTGVALAAGAARITDGLELLVSAPAAAAPPPSRNAAPVTAIAMVLRVHLMSSRTGPPMTAATSLARFFWARVIGCLGVTAYVPGWRRGTPASRAAFCRSYSCWQMPVPSGFLPDDRLESGPLA